MNYTIIDIKCCSRKYGIVTNFLCWVANWIYKIHDVPIRLRPLGYEKLLKILYTHNLKND